ncbi:methyltransferase [Aeromicrobium sp.]|uniref:SAM-dependent methyltransferase n=1 Tax=Aeromicrobium sp. TaxID=1871063 RepID=UPI0035199562
MASRTESLDLGLARVRQDVLDDAHLLRAVASGRRRGGEVAWRRVELRWVDIKAGRHLQVVRYDATQAHTSNHALGEAAAAELDGLLGEAFGNWTVETHERLLSLRVTKKGEAAVHTSRRAPAVADDARASSTVGERAPATHDRVKERLLPDDDPVFAALGMTDARGRVKPSRMAKYRQVEDFLRVLDTSVAEALAKGHLRAPTADDPLRVVDLGCGNGYLTFAAQRFLAEKRGLPVRLTGVDVKEQSREHNSAVAAELGVDARFVVGTIGEVELDERPDVVLALHACDTATDEALARAVEWEAGLVLAAPCCHHDIAAQLRRAPAPYPALVRDGILRERFADTLTDALRALLLRGQGYRVEVIEFVDSAHTPRNTLLRAVRTGVVGGREEYADLAGSFAVEPRLGELLGVRGG